MAVNDSFICTSNRIAGSHVINPGISGSGRMRILEVKNLGARQKLLLVSVNGEQILIGLTPQGMSRLGGWQPDEQSEIEEQLQSAPAEEKINSFKQLFKQTVKRQKD
jgi:flagellar biogenesis protein FliO